MIQKKIRVILKDKEYIIKEPKIEDYVLFLEDKEEFLNKLFCWEFPYKNLSNDELSYFIEKLFEFEKKFDEVLEDKKNIPFHIILAKLVKFFWNTFDDFMKMNFSFFMKLLQDFEKIVDEKQEDNKQVAQASSASELRKLLW